MDAHVGTLNVRYRSRRNGDASFETQAELDRSQSGDLAARQERVSRVEAGWKGREGEGNRSYASTTTNGHAHGRASQGGKVSSPSLFFRCMMQSCARCRQVLKGKRTARLCGGRAAYSLAVPSPSSWKITLEPEPVRWSCAPRTRGTKASIACIRAAPYLWRDAT